MILTNRPCALVVSLWLSLLMVSASAETVYVSDRFEIGVHDGIKIDSVILAVIPSGTPLTVIAKNGDVVQVKTREGRPIGYGFAHTRSMISVRMLTYFPDVVPDDFPIAHNLPRTPILP